MVRLRHEHKHWTGDRLTPLSSWFSEKQQDNGWMDVIGEMSTPAEQTPTWSSCLRQVNLHRLPPPPPAPTAQLSGDEFRTVCKSECGWGGGEADEICLVSGQNEMTEKTKRRIFIFHQSIHQKSHSFNFLSVFHLTVQIHVCEVVFKIHLENKSTFGMFHSVLKHAEHRTLNTYTEQLVLSKCSFFSCFFYLFSYRVALGYTEHDGTNRTRLDILL